MTISSTTRKAGPYIGNGTASVFPFAFKVFQASDVEVVRLTVATNIETTLALTTDYTVSLNQDQDSNPGGSITLVAGALATGYNLVITSDVENLQPTDLTNQGGFYPDVINDALDRATIQIQQLQEGLDRAALLPITSSADAASLVADIVRLADSADNLDIDANNIGSINTVATDIANVNTVGGAIANVNTVAGIAANVTTVAGISANVTTVAGISADVTVVADNITPVQSVGADLTGSPIVVDYGDLSPATNPATPTGAIGAVYAVRNDIQTVAGIDSEVVTVAGISSNVNTVAGIDSEVTTVAGISGNVTTVAGISSDVTDVAAIDVDVTAVAAIDSDIVIAANNVADITNFADVYQGPKATAPSLRNNGNPLQLGDLYFNTALDEMNVYTSTGWVVAYIPTAGFLAVANNLSDLDDAATARANLGLSNFGDLT